MMFHTLRTAKCIARYAAPKNNVRITFTLKAFDITSHNVSRGMVINYSEGHILNATCQ